MKRYLNTKNNEGVETVDELDSEDFETYAAFRAEMKRLWVEYSLAGTTGYWSQRPANNWR